MQVGYGGKIGLTYNHIYDVLEVNNIIFIIRQIRKDADLIRENLGFVENLTTISNSKFESKYNNVVFDGPFPFTYIIMPGYENQYLIVKRLEVKNVIYGMSLMSAAVYDNNQNLINEFPDIDFLQDTKYNPVSSTDFIFIDRNIIKRINMQKPKVLIYTFDLTNGLKANDKLVILSQKLENGFFYVYTSITTFAGVQTLVTYKIDVNTGKLI